MISHITKPIYKMSWANTGLPLSNQLMYNGFILLIFWPYTVLPILTQYRHHVQTITKLYWTNIGPIWDTGVTVLDQTWHNYTDNTGPILVQYNHVYWGMTIILMLQKILDRIKILILPNTLALLKLTNTPRATIFSSIIRQEKTCLKF